MTRSATTYLPNILTAVLTVGLLTAAFVLTIVGRWRMYEKADRPGWACIVPFYNTFVYYDLIYGSGWRMLWLLVPLANIIVAIRARFDLAYVFDQDPSFGFGLLFLQKIFICILGFHSEIEYLGTLDEIYEDELREEELQNLRQQEIDRLREKAERMK